MTDDRERKARYVRLVGTLAMVPFVLAAGPLTGYLLGRLLDSWLGTEPILSVIFLALGLAAAVREIARIVRRAGKDLDRL
jgi:F0F1-type ATP synthase assembly protein I